MAQKIYRILAIAALILAILGAVSFGGGIRPVNIDAFLFPLLISGIFFLLYRKISDQT